jgi:hypothetical protein
MSLSVQSSLAASPQAWDEVWERCGICVREASSEKDWSDYVACYEPSLARWLEQLNGQAPFETARERPDYLSFDQGA